MSTIKTDKVNKSGKTLHRRYYSESDAFLAGFKTKISQSSKHNIRVLRSVLADVKDRKPINIYMMSKKASSQSKFKVLYEKPIVSRVKIIKSP